MQPLRRQKEALLPEDLIAMLETLDRGTLRGLRDRAMLLIGFAGGLRRSEITGSISGATRPKTVVAGSKSSTRGY
jgi:site-specific recombinase XerD